MFPQLLSRYLPNPDHLLPLPLHLHQLLLLVLVSLVLRLVDLHAQIVVHEGAKLEVVWLARRLEHVPPSVLDVHGGARRLREQLLLNRRPLPVPVLSDSLDHELALLSRPFLFRPLEARVPLAGTHAAGHALRLPARPALLGGALLPWRARHRRERSRVFARPVRGRRGLGGGLGVPDEREREHRAVFQAVVGERRIRAKVVDEPFVQLDDLSIRG
mmetsp:Transcript_8224/g.33226  ORF Transcript_8224/g.33226 Transcript_8224/m.33226 type:complete len:216 (+) Transcript_8224:555-1202(+)